MNGWWLLPNENEWGHVLRVEGGDLAHLCSDIITRLYARHRAEPMGLIVEGFDCKPALPHGPHCVWRSPRCSRNRPRCCRSPAPARSRVSRRTSIEPGGYDELQGMMVRRGREI